MHFLYIFQFIKKRLQTDFHSIFPTVYSFENKYGRKKWGILVTKRLGISSRNLFYDFFNINGKIRVSVTQPQ